MSISAIKNTIDTNLPGNSKIHISVLRYALKLLVDDYYNEITNHTNQKKVIKSFNTISDMQDLGTSDFNVLSYKEDMLAFCIENHKVYKWREEIVPNEQGGILLNSYTYGNGIIDSGITYSNRVFNFFIEISTNVPAIPVILSGGKTLGKYVNGDTVPAAASIQAQLADIAQELTLPTFNLPTANLSATIAPNSSTEVGSSISPDFTAVLTLNDGGAANQYVINKDGSPILTDLIINNIISSITLGTTPIIFQAVVDYDAGTTPKNDSLGNPVANTIVAGSANSNILSYRGYYKIFYGPVASVASTSVQVRALASNRFQNAGNIFNLATGNTQLNFQFWLPNGVNLISVIDLDAFNANITGSYVANALSVNDAGGTPVAGTLYTLTQGVPYGTSHNHQITIS